MGSLSKPLATVTLICYARLKVQTTKVAMWLLDSFSSVRLRWCATILTCLSLQVTLQANEFFLNEVMPKEVQKKTGVADLSYKQRLALESWLNETFVLKNPPEKKKATEYLYLSQNINNGKILELNDGSRWEVAPDDVERSSYWIVPFPLYFTQNKDTADNQMYPLKIVNQNTGIGVKVRQLRAPDVIEKPPEK